MSSEDVNSIGWKVAICCLSAMLGWLAMYAKSIDTRVDRNRTDLTMRLEGLARVEERLFAIDRTLIRVEAEVLRWRESGSKKPLNE